jgi:hypothetical protein
MQDAVGLGPRLALLRGIERLARGCGRHARAPGTFFSGRQKALNRRLVSSQSRRSGVMTTASTTSSTSSIP